MQDFESSLPMLLYRALDTVMPRFRRIFSSHGLTETQWRVLRVLWEKKRVSFRELAKMTLIPAPSLVGVLDRLNALGFVERERDDRDRRQVYVTATAAGRQLESIVTPEVERAYRQLADSMDPNSWYALLSQLKTLSEKADVSTS